MKSVGRPAASSLGFTVKSTTIDAPMIGDSSVPTIGIRWMTAIALGTSTGPSSPNSLAMFWSNFVISKAMILNDSDPIGSVSTVAYGT